MVVIPKEGLNVSSLSSTVDSCTICILNGDSIESHISRGFRIEGELESRKSNFWEGRRRWRKKNWPPVDAHILHGQACRRIWVPYIKFDGACIQVDFIWPDVHVLDCKNKVAAIEDLKVNERNVCLEKKAGRSTDLAPLEDSCNGSTARSEIDVQGFPTTLETNSIQVEGRYIP